MPTLEMPEFNPKKIADEMIKRMKQAKAFEVKCYVDEAFVFMGKPLPFDLSMKDGLYKCKVIAPTMKDAMKMVSDFMPVIKFVENNE
jgi:thioredoxin reductase